MSDSGTGLHARAHTHTHTHTEEKDLSWYYMPQRIVLLAVVRQHLRASVRDEMGMMSVHVHVCSMLSTDDGGTQALRCLKFGGCKLMPSNPWEVSQVSGGRWSLTLPLFLWGAYSVLLPFLSASLTGEDRRVESGATRRESFFISVSKTMEESADWIR